MIEIELRPAKDGKKRELEARREGQEKKVGEDWLELRKGVWNGREELLVSGTDTRTPRCAGHRAE